MAIMRFWITSTLVLTLLGTTACDRATTVEETLPPTSGNTEQPTPPTEPTPDASGTTTTTPISTDYTVIPGERVGQVTSTTSRQQLADLYGEANLQDEDVNVGEGFTEPGTVVKLGSDQHFTVIWLNVDRSKPLMAQDFSNQWKTPEGIGIGTPYPELQTVLGDFQLYGFAWDYGGTLSLEGSKLDKYYGNLLLRVNPSEASVDAHPEAFQAVRGDQLFPSDDPNLAQLDIVVESMVVYLNEPVY